MDMRGLRYFIAAAEYLNFTRAAKECFITQTAMSLHIAKMEEELGFQLFTRNNRTVELTLAGRDFYERAQDIVRNYESAVQHAASTASGTAGNVTVIIPSCIDGLLLMPRFRKFQKDCPAVKLNVEIVEPRNILGVLKRGEADVAICWPYDLELDPEFTLEKIADFKVSVAISCDHPFATLDKVPPELLQKEKHVILEPRGVPNAYRTFRNGWLQMGFEPQTVRKVHQIEELLFFAQLDGDVAFLPDFVKNNITGDVLFKELDTDTPPVLTLTTAYRKDNKSPILPAIIRALLDDTVPLNE